MLQRTIYKTFSNYLRALLFFSFFVFIPIVIYQNITNLNSICQRHKPYMGAMGNKNPNFKMSRVFHLCSIINKYYDRNTILITPNIDKIDKIGSMLFNKYFQFYKRWTVLLALRYPQPTNFRNYKWHLSQDEAKLLAKKAIKKERIEKIEYFIFKKPTNNEIGVFVFQNYVFLAPLNYLEYDL
jgi:hypothetical protein